ncbi:MAG TPA: ATP-binding protein [Acidimicrobiales bacterium]|nr:ATP-binding protein [Acidimicrobiales bacterium]
MPEVPAAAPRRFPHLRRVVASVRFRVTALATFALFAVLAATGVALVLAQVRVLTGGLDESLERRADDLAALVGAGPPPAVLPGGEDDDVVAQLLGPDGTVVAASEALDDQPALPVPEGAVDGPVTVDPFLPDDDEEYRVLARLVDTPGGERTLLVAGELDDVTESSGVLAGSLLIAVPLASALLAALVWWLVGRTLRPVEAIRAEVAGIGGADLHRRVPVPPIDDEVARLARTMNGMLDRVEDGVRRQQRFVADASHEMRTPLARMRAEMEVDEAHPGTADTVATRRSVLAEVEGLQRLVGDLLYLARSDAGALDGASGVAAPAVERTAVDLDDLVLAGAATLRLVARDVRVDTSGVTAAQVLGSADQLARVVGNLADNAARHAASSVAFTLAEDGERAVLTVTDDGPGIPAEDAERVFDRFTRLDEARTGGRGGTGLGLAIARDIVRRHGGTIAVDTAPRAGDGPAGARLVVTLPLAPDGT